MMGAVFAGLAAGLLTGAGIGGGTLLLVYLTNLGGMELRQAQGVNLIYFLITAPPALWGHFKNDLVDKPLALRAGAAGLLARAENGAFAMLPRDVLNKLGPAFLELEG